MFLTTGVFVDHRDLTSTHVVYENDTQSVSLQTQEADDAAEGRLSGSVILIGLSVPAP